MMLLSNNNGVHIPGQADYTQEEYDQWQLAKWGNSQGDYQDSMQKKTVNVIDCLTNEPFSK
jgi:hypothetical protein